MPFKANLEMSELRRHRAKILRRTLLWLAAMWPIHPLAVLQAQPPSECHDADLILRNGKIVTRDTARSIVSSLAVRDGKILATGSDSEIAACSSARTQTIDLKGQTVLPGLIDVHTHALSWAEGLLQNALIQRSIPSPKS